MACNISGFTPNQKPYIHVVPKVEPYLGTVSHIPACYSSLVHSSLLVSNRKLVFPASTFPSSGISCTIEQMGSPCKPQLIENHFLVNICGGRSPDNSLQRNCAMLLTKYLSTLLQNLGYLYIPTHVVQKLPYLSYSYSW